jgi:hypothetical protein
MKDIILSPVLSRLYAGVSFMINRSGLYIVVFTVIVLLLPVTGVLAQAPSAANAGEGYFQIDSEPRGAEVLFDGVFVGETPVMVPVLSTGIPQHTIALSKPGYFPWVEKYSTNPGPGETISVFASLEPSTSFGSLIITSTPSGALITVDGSKGQQAPWTYTDISTGSHLVQAFLSGYEPYAKIVDVPPGGTARVDAVLIPLTNVGSLQVITSPGGADVYVDGVFKGASATTIGNLAAGKHFVLIKLAGYDEWTDTVEIMPNQVKILDITLKVRTDSNTGDIQVESVPPGAAVFLDGNYEGHTQNNNPLDITGVDAGTHIMSIRLENYQDYNSSVAVEAGQTTTVKAQLDPSLSPGQSGTIQISSQPQGANIFIDNAYKGITPLTIPSVETGTHSLLIRLPGYNDYSSTFSVDAGQAIQIDVSLTPSPTSAGCFPFVMILALVVAAFCLKKYGS